MVACSALPHVRGLKYDAIAMPVHSLCVGFQHTRLDVGQVSPRLGTPLEYKSVESPHVLIWCGVGESVNNVN